MQSEDTNNTIQRIEGETTTDYLKRIEGNTSSLSLDAKPVLIGLASNDKFYNHILEQEGTPFLTATRAFADEKYFTLGFGRNNKNIKEGEKKYKLQYLIFLIFQKNCKLHYLENILEVQLDNLLTH